MTPTPLMTIGAFAQAARLSPKALRLYDDLGLLRPAQVDAGSGYRRYDPAQLEDARLIGLLRRADLPLTDIQALLGAPAPDRPAALRAHLARLDRLHRERRDLTLYLIARLQGETPMTLPPVQTRFQPEQSVAALTRHVFVADLPGAIQSGMQALIDLVNAQGGMFGGAPFVIYHGDVNADSDGPIEICVPYRGPLTPGGDVTLRVEPAHHEAFLALTREQFEFPAILVAYDATCAAAAAHGTCTLRPREVYAYDWDGAAPGDPVGDVAWPYEPVMVPS
ncbi:MerR family transcriptional regulator [Deinococcus radiotolerans]|uniref:MerR family transcriptional regulator n=1 Tax=Deinococcus radiotolerans TaxID=1309407 RepID=A0ABQ2FKU9_9DEIO|nr:helix-turn-helix domain-containing protein [Deinococcus radiotolerans]GGK97983.1 MerR family transcriptional regulator [Deinococcus radiotolerans]